MARSLISSSLSMSAADICDHAGVCADERYVSDATCAGPDSIAAYRSERMSTHVVPSGALTAMSTMSSSPLPARRRTSTKPCASASSAANQTLSTAAGNISRGLELSARRAT